MKTYKSTLIVHADKIAAVRRDGQTVSMTLASDGSTMVNSIGAQAAHASVGDYFVRHVDGMVSAVPPAAFESRFQLGDEEVPIRRAEGGTLLEDANLQITALHFLETLLAAPTITNQVRDLVRGAHLAVLAMMNGHRPPDFAARISDAQAAASSDDFTETALARVAHEITRLYRLAVGDLAQLPWDSAPKWERERAVARVKECMSHAGQARGDAVLFGAVVKALA